LDSTRHCCDRSVVNEIGESDYLWYDDLTEVRFTEEEAINLCSAPEVSIPPLWWVGTAARHIKIEGYTRWRLSQL